MIAKGAMSLHRVARLNDLKHIFLVDGCLFVNRSVSQFWSDLFTMPKDEISFSTISSFILFSISIIRLTSSSWNILPQIRDRSRDKAPLLYARFYLRCLQVSLFTILIALNRSRSSLEIQAVI